ncbi:MAG: multidrug effflux MFS transporter [Gammaproteobacteria bacterium]|nr:multidrug effflux MFS transporter [Gammaproteobacteria bacterium]
MLDDLPNTERSLKNITPFQWLLLLVPLSTSISFAMDIFIPSLTDITMDFNTTASTVQWTLSIFMFGVALGQLIIGPLADRFGKKRLTIISCIIFTLASLWCSLATSINMLIVARAVQSIGACGTYVLSYAIVRDCFEPKQSAKLYSQMTGISSIAPMIAPIIGGYLAYTTNTWRSSFFGLFVIGLLMLIISVLKLPETNFKHYNSNSEINLFTILFAKNFLPYALLAATCIVALFGFCCLSPRLLIEHLDVPKQNFGYYFGLNALVLITANLISSKLVNYFSLGYLVIASLVLISMGSIIMLLLSLYYPLNILNFLIPMLIISAGVGLSVGPSAASAMRDYAHCSGSAAAVYGSLQFLIGGIVGTIVLNFSFGSATPFAVSVLISALLTIGIIIKSPNKHVTPLY